MVTDMVEPSRGVTEIYSPPETGKNMIPIYHIKNKSNMEVRKQN